MVLQLNIFGGVSRTVKSSKITPYKPPKRVAPLEKLVLIHKLYEQIYNYLDINPFTQEERIQKGYLIAYPEDRQAEVINTWYLTLDERIEIHKIVLEKLEKKRQKWILMIL